MSVATAAPDTARRETASARQRAKHAEDQLDRARGDMAANQQTIEALRDQLTAVRTEAATAAGAAAAAVTRAEAAENRLDGMLGTAPHRPARVRRSPRTSPQA
jgi:chromosome segregation ATPase